MTDPSAVSRANDVREIGPVSVTVALPDQAIGAVLKAIRARHPTTFGFCNAHTVNMARRNGAFAEALRSATVFNDGIGVDVASRLLYGSSFPANLNGTDFTPLLLSRLDKPTRVFLLGSPPGVARRAADVLVRTFANVVIAGCRDGFFEDREGATVAEEIRATGAELVLVAMGHPRQELWAARHGNSTGAVLLCVGAYLDFAAGRVSRAPTLVRAMRCEWIYRLMLEPRRLARRYLIGNVAFLTGVFRDRVRLRASSR